MHFPRMQTDSTKNTFSTEKANMRLASKALFFKTSILDTKIWSIFFSKKRQNLLHKALKWKNRIGFFMTGQQDQIGQFIALWATFQSLWEQLFCTKRPHFKANFVKLTISFIFSEIIFWQLLQTFGDFLLVTLSQVKLK